MIINIVNANNWNLIESMLKAKEREREREREDS